jgi:hypothetical protein
MRSLQLPAFIGYSLKAKQFCRDFRIHERSTFVFVAFFDETIRD